MREALDGGPWYVFQAFSNWDSVSTPSAGWGLVVNCKVARS